jgi:prolyl oligopeptidase
VTAARASAPAYPDAPRLDLVDDLHGTAVADPYRWLEDPADERTVACQGQPSDLMDEERSTWDRRDHFVGRVAELLGSGSVSPPYYRGTRYFLTRREPGQQFAVLYLVDDAGERVLLDPMILDPSGRTTLDAWQPSKEGTRLAYQLSVGGNEESLLYVMDVDSGEILEGPIDRCRYSPVAWVPGGDSYYCVRRIAPELLPESERNFHRRVYLHHVGQPTDVDSVVFGAGMTMTN